MLHMLGMVAQSGEMFSAEHVADAEVGFEGDGDDEGFASDAREVADGVGWAIEMLEDLEAGDDVEAGVGEGSWSTLARMRRGAALARMDSWRRSRQTGLRPGGRTPRRSSSPSPQPASRRVRGSSS